MPIARLENLSLKPQASEEDNENIDSYDRDLDEDDEFFDAEDASTPNQTTTNDVEVFGSSYHEELDHDAVN